MRNPTTSIPERLLISPMSLTYPCCKAKRGKDCGYTSRGLAALHIERVELAALADEMAALRKKAEKRRRANGVK